MQSCLPTDKSRAHPVLKQLTSTAPIITQIDGLLTPAEASFLVQKAHDAGFEASETGGHRDDGEVTSLRTSRTASLPEDEPAVACIRRRLATVALMPVESLEPLQATRYGYRQQYKSHHDDDVDAGSTGHQRRLKTIFAYLQADGNLPTGNCGGSTRFDRLRQQDGKALRVYPAAGRALMWNNWDDAGKRDLRTHHRGEKVTCPGVEKIGLNAWFHAEKVPQLGPSPRAGPRGTRVTGRAHSKRGSRRQ